MTSRRRLRWLALVAAVGALACRAQRAAGPATPEDEVRINPEQVERREVRVVEAREAPSEQTVAAAGRIAFDDLRVQHVVSPVAGQVTRLLAEPGQRVRTGSPLLALLSPDVGSALSDVVKARADLALATAELRRQERIVAARAGPRRDLEAAQDAQRKADAELARANQRAALLQAGGVDAVTQEVVLRSAIDGEVLARAATPGMQVQGSWSGGTPFELFTVGDLSRVWVLADVPEADVARVRPGAQARVSVAAWPGRTFAGAVDWIAGTLDPALRTARVRLTLPNPDRALKPEMLAQVAIQAPGAPALVVPRGAVVTIEGEAFAYVAQGRAPDGQLRFVRRRLHVSSDGADAEVVVHAGLSAGDRVLVDEGRRRPSGDGEVRLTRRQFENAGIRLAPAVEGDAGDTLTAGARVTFDDSRVAHVFSPVTGRVTRVLAQPGQHVKRGAPLLALVSPDVGTAFADAVKAQADLIAARHEADRQRELFEAQAGARKDLEAAEAAWSKARAEVDRASQKTRLLAAGTWDAVTQEYTLRSPIDGEVVARAATAGMEVQGQWASAGAPVELFTIGALDPLWVLGDVFEMDLTYVRKGLPVTVRVPAFPDRTFTGRVDWISNVLDPATRTAKVRCAIANPDRLLRPEMAPILSVSLPARHHVGVPREALLRLGDDTVVFVAAGDAVDGKLAFRRRKVVVGDERAKGVVPILDGLAPGEQVVTSGGIFLVGLL
jgi:cobalt-zinc-cadmium efflux system membrane fusion protein